MAAGRHTTPEKAANVDTDSMLLDVAGAIYALPLMTLGSSQRVVVGNEIGAGDSLFGVAAQIEATESQQAFQYALPRVFGSW